MTAIIDYNTGNLFSLTSSLDRIGVQYQITSSPETILCAESVILPGVGEASNAMSALRERGLDRVIPLVKSPILGICIGMQVLCKESEEGEAICLGIFPNKVRRLVGSCLKVPHMGWNSVEKTDSPLFKNIQDGTYFYFVHSFAPECGSFTIATTNYGGEFSSALSKENFFGTQFHPEKSGSAGERILENFVNIKIR